MIAFYPHVRIEKYVVMPNHIHLLIAIQQGPSGASRTPPPTSARASQVIPMFISTLKRLTNKTAGHALWQRGYYDHIIRSPDDYNTIWHYIDTNPAKWAQDTRYVTDFPDPVRRPDRCTNKEVTQMSRYFTKTLAALEPYTPGEQLKLPDLVKLNANENPYPPAPGVAAAVAAAVILCVACASGALQATVAAFSALFGISSPAQTQVIQDRAQVIQTSDTDNGVTVSMESVMGDAHNAQILFSIRRTDGQPLLPQRPDLSWLINQDHALLFEEDSTLNMFTPAEDDQPDRYLLSSALHFVPFEATDSVLYFLFSVSSPNYPLPSGGMSLTLRNLCSYGPVSGKDEKGSIPLVEGTWDLSFHLEYDTSTLSLPTGQTFHHGPLTGTVEEIRLSPISIYLSFRYTFEEETLAAGYDPGATELSKEAWLEEQKREWFSNLPLYVTFPDGTTQDIQQDTVDLGGFSQGSVYTLSGARQTVLPLDSIASFHLGDLTIPLPD